MYNDLFNKLNLSPTASKVYIILLDLGKASADQIAKKANNYKSNVYNAIEKLKENGLCSEVNEGNKRLFVPTNPNKLSQLIEETKENNIKKLDELKEEINKILPSLTKKFKSVKEKESFEIYRGKKAYKLLINEILKENPKSWKGFGNLQIQYFFPLEFKRWFKNIKIRLFSTKSEEVLKRLKEAKQVCDTKITWLPKELFMPVVWVIFGNNVLIIIYEPEIILMRIKSEQIIKTFSNQFDYLWKKYKGDEKYEK